MRLRLVAAVGLVGFLATPAHAQLGGLAKKMKEKAMEAAANKAADKVADKTGLNLSPPTYDDVIVELTPARVDALLKGLDAEKRALTANGGSAPLLKQREELEAQIKSLDERVNTVRGGYDNARSRWSSCDSDVRRGLEKTHEDEARKGMAAVIADPVKAGEKSKQATQFQQELASAIASGDSTAIKKATYNYYKLWGIDFTKDDAAVKAKCGAAPTKPSAMLELDAANARRDSVDVRIRAIENGAVLEGSKASGLSEQAFAMAKERAQMALTGSRTAFNRGELTALDAKKSELLVFLKP